ncbi:hypothetical protein DRJ22_03700, partial [Candidatus Woesearchaeota archaeon]
MKKMFFLLMLVVFCVSFCTGVFAGGVAPFITASILKYEPSPAEQGRTIDVWVKLHNEGTQANNVAIKFLPEYPFSLPDGARNRFDIGVIPETEDAVVKFSVFVDPNAPNGDRDITFLYKFDTANDWIKFTAPITLQTKTAGLIIKNYLIDPREVVPGQKCKLKLTVENSAKIAMKNVDVVLVLPEQFSVVEGSSKKRIGLINAGEKKDVEFILASDSSTKVGVFTIPVTLNYQDITNTDYSETSDISLIVNAEPEIDLLVDSVEFKSKTSPGVVSLKIVNKGVVDVKFVTVNLINSPENYETLSVSSKKYVGNLDSDDFETVDFRIKPVVKFPKLYVELEFKDPYNKDFKRSFVLPLKIFTAKELGKSGYPVGLFVVLALIVAGGIWFFRRK